VLLLYVLSTRVLWHGEARYLGTTSSPEFFEPTARDDSAGGFLFLGANGIELKLLEETTKWLNTRIRKCWFQRSGQRTT
jgi:hypothetical protein